MWLRLVNLETEIADELVERSTVGTAEGWAGCGEELEFI